MADTQSNLPLVCGVCGRKFYYNDLKIEPSWNGKWKCYRSPCCDSEQWSSIKEISFLNKYINRSNVIF